MNDLAQHLDALGLDAELDADDFLIGAVCVLSVLIPGDSRPRLVIANSENLSWIEQAGLLYLAMQVCSELPGEDEE